MGVESTLNKVADLRSDWPVQSDHLYETPDHLRNIKAALHTQFTDESVLVPRTAATDKSYVRGKYGTTDAWLVGKSTTGTGVELKNEIEGSSISVGGQASDKRIYYNAGTNGAHKFNAPVEIANGYIRNNQGTEINHSYFQSVYTEPNGTAHEMFSIGKTGDDVSLRINSTITGASIALGGGTMANPSRGVSITAGTNNDIALNGSHVNVNGQLVLNGGQNIRWPRTYTDPTTHAVSNLSNIFVGTYAVPTLHARWEVYATDWDTGARSNMLTYDITNTDVANTKGVLTVNGMVHGVFNGRNGFADQYNYPYATFYDEVTANSSTYWPLIKQKYNYTNGTTVTHGVWSMGGLNDNSWNLHHIDDKGAGKTWRFGADGTTTFPGNIGNISTGTIASGNITAGNVVCSGFTCTGANAVIKNGTKANDRSLVYQLADGSITTSLINQGTTNTFYIRAYTVGQTAKYVDFKFDTAGHITANGANITSDARMKTDITPIDPADKIDQIGGYTYTKNEITETGLIAQEVGQIIPDAVHMSDGILSLNYNSVIALLVEEVKALRKRVEVLENE